MPNEVEPGIPFDRLTYVLMQVHFSRRTGQEYMTKFREYSTLASAKQDAKNLKGCSRWVILEQRIVEIAEALNPPE